MRRPLLVLACAVLVGCGGGRSDEEEVRETVAAFGSATAERDYERLCEELFAPDLVEALEQIGLPCRVAMEQALGKVEDPRLVIGAITVDGDEATAEVRSSAKDQRPSRDTMTLVRVEDRWRIADLGGSPSPRSSPSPTP